MYYYNNKPIEKTNASLCESPTKEITNLLLNQPIHAIEYNDEATFVGSAKPNMNYNTDSALLTDGVFAKERNFGEPEWFHIHGGTGRCITFKLEYLSAVNGFLINTTREDEVGVRSPRYVKIRVSADGESFQTVFEADSRTTRDKAIHRIEGEFSPVKALYVQFVIDSVHHVYIDEIQLYGCTDLTNAATPVNDGKPVFNSFPTPDEVNEYPNAEIVGAHNIDLTYNYRPYEPDKGLQTREDYLPLVGYLSPEGKILDTFMDGYLFLPDVTFVFHPDGQNAKGWQEYIDCCFVPDKNVDALNKTAKEVGTALGNPDYKVSVYFTILYTFSGHDEFGVVNGEKLVFDNLEHRKKAVKWLMDSMIEKYNAGNYSNTELKGFYWFEEAFNPTDRFEFDMINFASDYAHQKGYKCFWIPYYKALGYENWKSYGLDTACMQPNYAFEDHIPKQRLYDNAKEAKRMGMCVEMEVWKIQEDENGNIDNPNNIEKFMDYMYAGAETGSMMSCKMYYHGSAPGGVITNGWKSKNKRYREMYDTCYLFAKEKLEPKK